MEPAAWCHQMSWPVGRDVTVVDVAGAMSAALLAATAAAPRLQLGGKGKLDPAPLHVSSCDHWVLSCYLAVTTIP